MPARSGLWATIDRIERNQKGKSLAVLVFDDGQQLVVPVELLPAGARAQQVIRLLLQVDAEETARRSAEIEKLQRELFGE